MKLEEFMRDWPHRKSIDGKSLSEILAIDGIPIWWFYNRFFIGHVMPRQLNTFDRIKKSKKLKTLDRIKLSVYSGVSRRYLLVKEKKKIKFLKKEPKPTNKKKALFLTYTNHLNNENKLYRVQKIIDKIKERGNIKELVIFADPLSSKKYTTLKNRQNIYQYYTEESADKAEIESERLLKLWYQIKIGQKREMLYWNNTSLWDYLKYAFNFFFSKEFFYLTALYYYMFKDLLAKENVKVVVITSQNSIFEKCLIAAANRLHVNVLRLQHGIGEEIVAPDDYDLKNNYFYKLVFSDFLKKEAMAVGWPREKLIVVGPVVFDHIAAYVGEKKKQGNNVLFATIPAVQSNLITEKEYLNRIKTILKKIQEIKNIQLTIKLHPREVPKERCINNYKKILEELKFNEAKVFGGDVLEEKFYEMIKKSDLLVNFGSTVAIEAMIIGRPTITIDLLGTKFHTTWIEGKGITTNVDWNGDIVGAVNKALSENKEMKERCREYIGRKCGKIDGKAAENVATTIEKMSGC